MQIPFTGGAYKTFSPNINAEECVNFIPITDDNKRVLRGSPGLKVWCDTGHYAEVRGVDVMGAYIYAVIGSKVFQIDSNKVSTECAGMLNTTSGAVSMSNNGTQVIIVDGNKGYIVTGTTIASISDDGFPNNPNSVTYQDGYFLVTAHNTGQINISDLNDGTSWDSTYNFNAEAKPDDALKVLSHHRNVNIFGINSTETWYNSGATVPFDRIPGTTQEMGIGSAASAVVVANSIYYMTNNRQAAVLEGNLPKAIMPPSVAYQISLYGNVDDAIGMGVENVEGVALYIITFPKANATWGYNIFNKEWFQLKSYPEPFNNRWRGNCLQYFDSKCIVGDYENGILYEWDFGTFTDNGEYIRRVRVAPEIRKEGKNIFHNELQIFFESGKGLVTGQGSDPQVMLMWSDDGGHTWSNEYWRSAGKVGEYERRVRWTRLGSSRHRNYRIEMSDPIKWIIFEANLEVHLGSV